MKISRFRLQPELLPGMKLVLDPGLNCECRNVTSSSNCAQLCNIIPLRMLLRNELLIRIKYLGLDTPSHPSMKWPCFTMQAICNFSEFPFEYGWMGKGSQTSVQVVFNSRQAVLELLRVLLLHNLLVELT